MNKLFLLLIFFVFAIINFSGCSLFMPPCEEHEFREDDGICYDNSRIQEFDYRMYWQLRLENIKTKLNADTPLKEQINITMVPYSTLRNNFNSCPWEDTVFNYRFVTINNNKETEISEYRSPILIDGPIYVIIESYIMATSGNVNWTSKEVPLTKAQVLDVFNNKTIYSTLSFRITINGKEYRGDDDNIFYYDVVNSEVEGKAKEGERTLADKDTYWDYSRSSETPPGCISYPLTEKEYVFDMSSISK